MEEVKLNGVAFYKHLVRYGPKGEVRKLLVKLAEMEDRGFTETEKTDIAEAIEGIEASRSRSADSESGSAAASVPGTAEGAVTATGDDQDF